jgi:hypothetical protein
MTKITQILTQKSSSRNPTHQRFSYSTKKSLLISLNIFSFDFVKFFDKIIQYSIALASYV